MKTKFISLLAAIALPIVSPSVSAQFCDDDEFLGVLSANPFLADSTSNEFGEFGSPLEADSISNPFGKFGSPYSPTSINNPYATSAPKIIAVDGQYLGRLSANPYDSDSVSNPYGQYGSPYSPTSIKNPYSQYGSPYCLARARESRHEVAVLHTGFRAAAPAAWFADQSEQSLCHETTDPMRVAVTKISSPFHLLLHRSHAEIMCA